jgi:alkylhydroperoxidase family enzyme
MTITEPATTTDGTGFLEMPPTSGDVRRLYDDSLAQQGFVMNLTRLWAHQPALHRGLFDLAGEAVRAGELTFRQRAVLVVAAASAFGDGYCSLAWGSKLAGVSGEDMAGRVLRGDDDGLDPAERALAGWARRVARDPNATEARDVQPLREAGYDEAQIFAITVFVALRLAFAIVNDALGARPDAELLATVPGGVRQAVTYGRRAVGAQSSAHHSRERLTQTHHS